MTASHYIRFDTGSGRREEFRTPGSVLLQDAGTWLGLRLEQWHGQSRDLPESVLEDHMIAVSLVGTTSSEISWTAHGRVARRFEAGTVGIFPAAMPYVAHSRGVWDGFILAISPKSLARLAPGQASARIELIPEFAVADPLIWGATAALAKDIRDEYPFGPIYGESIAVALAAHLLRTYSPGARISLIAPKSADVLRDRVEEYILGQLREPLTLARLAACVQMDSFSFSRWFRRAFGVPPHRYILQARIARSKALLQRSAMPISEIAMECGFNSASHFATAFLRCVGVSPRSYRLMSKH